MTEETRRQGGSVTRQKGYLDQLRRVLPPSPPWEEWLATSGELPPDLSLLPSQPELPDALTFADGRPVTAAAAWERRREELKALFQQWVLGRVPPPPDNLQATVLAERQQVGATLREVELTFGPDRRARLWLELMIPPGTGPFPVFMTQHNHRGWALIALRRGYLACIYAGADSRDDTDSFMAAYPGYDWSRLMRRAWAASRAVDYLVTLPEADSERIALTGHSRNGKQSLMASALDERFAVVISSSSGAGGCMPARYCAEPHFGEGIELLTRVFPDWFHPRLRFFAGREDRLPVDFHELVALSAPRPCLLSIALNDGVESSWAMEETYRAVKRVYRLLGVEDRLRILWRPGSHETWPAIIERYIDWCDAHLRGGANDFSERLIHPHDWEAWRVEAGEGEELPAPVPTSGATPVPDLAGWEARRAEVRERVRWMLGEPPPGAPAVESSYGQEPPHIAALLRRDLPGEGVEKQQTVFGEYINGDVYAPAGLSQSGHRVPAILWLHPFSFPLGYSAAYKQGEQFYITLARAGFVVFCFDQIGCGRRIEEVEDFYRRYPRWSLLGKMVRDAQAALDRLTSLPYVDAGQLWAVGYGLGGLVGLHLGALDGRLAGVASVCGPEPFRCDTTERGKGGIGRWSHRHMLLPRLGLYVGREAEVPYDIEHLLASLAPRPVLVVSPLLDREAAVEDVTTAVEGARQVYALYGAADHLQHAVPEDYGRLGPEVQGLVIDWLKKASRDGGA